MNFNDIDSLVDMAHAMTAILPSGQSRAWAEDIVYYAIRLELSTLRAIYERPGDMSAMFDMMDDQLRLVAAINPFTDAS